MRLEHLSGYGLTSGVVSLPALGAAVVRRFGSASLKLRAAYGKGIRAAQLGTPQSWYDSGRLQLGYGPPPEVQRGIEAGADLTVGGWGSVRLTRFDQEASGLVQAVPALVTARSGHQHVAYALQSVGRIGNRGWELQGSVAAGRLSLAGALSLVSSRVLQLADGYAGDLRVGDRMLGVPARTATLTASWAARSWFTSWSLSRASDWTNYDYLGLAEALARTSAAPGAVTGGELRGHWLHYPGVTRLRAFASRDLMQGLALTLTGENLLGQQLGAPDNITVVPGRTISLGFRARF
jgi:iron complex outermembrane receptor protein